MGFTLDNVVPWGRSFDEYVHMFALSADDLTRRILGCGDGPAAFNAELTRRGGHVVSVDPVFQFSAPQILSRIGDTYAKVMEQLRKNAADYVWTTFASPEEVAETRMTAMREFLADFASAGAQGRYVAGGVPGLPFPDASFDLALVSHFLFLYSKQLSASFHVEAIRDLLRVATEVRIFPVLTLDGRPCPHLAPVMDALSRDGFRARLAKVPYEFQKDGNQMLVVSR